MQNNFSDLLTRGRSTGQAVHMLHNPLKRKAEEAAEAEAAALDPKAQGHDAKSEAPESEAATAEDGASQLEDEDDESGIKRETYNMVCYGLPNLLITQIGKV